MRTTRLPRIIEVGDLRIAACRRAIAQVGSREKIASSIGITAQAVGAWKLVPAEHCIVVEKLSGVSRYELRPDVYGTGGEIPVASPLLLLVHCAIGTKALAEAVELPVEVVSAWDKIPAELVLKIERLSGVSRYRLRPDVFGEGPEVEAA